MARKILTVDDSKTMRQMVSFTLKGAGFEVIEAEDGLNALEVLGNDKVDLVITDLNMPNMDGFGLIDSLRSHDVHKFCPILLLSTEGSEALRLAAKDRGATGWIVKPFNPEKLMRIISKVLG